MTYRWITLDNGRSVYRKEPVERGPASSLPKPMLISDQMADTWHPSDNRVYESKSQFRRATHKHGGVEVGNELQTDARVIDQATHQDVGEAIKKVKEGYRPTVTGAGSEGWQ